MAWNVKLKVIYQEFNEFFTFKTVHAMQMES